MAHPHPDTPSLKQFVDAAERQGCVMGVIERTGLRYLETQSGAVAFLPDIPDEDLIRPEKLAYLVRALGVTGYAEILVCWGYGEDGADKPRH